ncbi:MAG: hypothetical protein AAGA63_12870 [Pseudomonadota bacterium]
MLKLSKYRSNESGAVSVEFVIIISGWIFAVTTLFVVSGLVAASNKGYKANALVSNVAARQDSITDDTMDALTSVFEAVVGGDSSTTTVRLSHLTNNDGVLEIDWSISSEGASACLAKDAPVIAAHVPVITSGYEILLVETTSQFSPIFTSTPIGNTNLRQVSTFIPRFVPKLDFDGDNPPAVFCTYDYEIGDGGGGGEDPEAEGG